MDIVHAVKTARAASEKAYAPYSDFRVGATVLTERGTVYGGCNVENASYGLTICAERNATAAMVFAEPKGCRIKLVAVVSPNTAPCFPCGACRQVLNEFGCEEVVVLGASGEIRRYSLDGLLPLAFGSESL